MCGDPRDMDAGKSSKAGTDGLAPRTEDKSDSVLAVNHRVKHLVTETREKKNKTSLCGTRLLDALKQSVTKCLHPSRKKLLLFWPVKVAQLLCVVYIMVLTFAPAPIGLVDPSSGDIIDLASPENTSRGVVVVGGCSRPVVAIGSYQKFCLALSRMSAFSMYPVLILVFLTKCKATIGFFSKTPIVMYMNNDSHEIHEYAGKYIAFDVWIHTLFHLLRWIDQGNASLLWRHRTGLTGLIVVIATPLITFPMMYWKQSLSYEVRKGLHFLFYLFAVGMCFHVPPTGIPNGGFVAYVLGFCITLYTLDALYVLLFMTEKIETTRFHVVPSGVMMTMDVSRTFQDRGNGGFAYVCLPWVARNQWHAFSLFEHPTEPQKRQVFMLKTGDWTKAVHEALQRNTVRPVWVQGPFVSPYSQAEAYDNQILVASGIGITPALSVIRGHKDSRRSNLIWVVRDPFMLEFFLEHEDLYLDHDGWNLIFYTGKQPLNPGLEERDGTNVRIIKGRPDLKSVIPNIIYGIESGVGLPEKYTVDAMSRVKEQLLEQIYWLDVTRDKCNHEKLAELTKCAHEHGFLLTDLMNQMENGQRLDGFVEEEDALKEPLVSQSRSPTENETVIDTESLYSAERASAACRAKDNDIEAQQQEQHGAGCVPNEVATVNFVPERRRSLDNSVPSTERASIACRAKDNNIEVHQQQCGTGYIPDGAKAVNFVLESRCSLDDSGNFVPEETIPMTEQHQPQSRRSTMDLASAHGSIHTDTTPNYGSERTGRRSTMDMGFVPADHGGYATTNYALDRARRRSTMDMGFTNSCSSMQMNKRGSMDTTASNMAELNVTKLRKTLRGIGGHGVGEVLTAAFDPWKKNSGAKDYVKGLDKDVVLSTWGILYCGGNRFIGEDLEKLSKEYKLALNLETFAW